MTDPSVGCPLTYVVLDPALWQTDPARFERQFDGFVAGYAKHFKGDEAESPAQWRARIAGKPAPQRIMRIVVAVDRSTGVERVVGGLVCEYYRASRCVLATYLYVLDEPEYRRRGHARSLLSEGLRVCQQLGPVGAVLAEAQWPEALMAAAVDPGTVALARERFRFFARLGARVVNIDYVQPSLSAAKRPVSYLKLCVFPNPSEARRLSDAELG